MKLITEPRTLKQAKELYLSLSNEFRRLSSDETRVAKIILTKAEMKLLNDNLPDLSMLMSTWHQVSDDTGCISSMFGLPVTIED